MILHGNSVPEADLDAPDGSRMGLHIIVSEQKSLHHQLLASTFADCILLTSGCSIGTFVQSHLSIALPTFVFWLHVPWGSSRQAGAPCWPAYVLPLPCAGACLQMRRIPQCESCGQTGSAWCWQGRPAARCASLKVGSQSLPMLAARNRVHVHSCGRVPLRCHISLTGSS